MKKTRFPVLKKLRVQMSLHYVIASLLTLACMGTILYYSMTSIVQKEETTTTETAIEQSGMYIDLYLDRLKAMSRIIAENPQLVNYLSTDERDASSKQDLLSTIRTTMSTDQAIESVVIVSKNGEILSNEKGLNMSMSGNMMKESWYMSAIENGDQPVLTSARMQDFSMDKDNWVISLSREVKDAKGKNIGVLLIDIQYKVIEDYLKNLNLGNQGFSFILNANNEVVYHENPSYFQNPVKQKYLQQIVDHSKTFDEKEGTFTYAFPLENADWTLVGVSSQDELVAIKDKLMKIVLAVGLVFLVLAIVSIVIFTGRITKPFKKLEQAMQDIEQGLIEIPVDERGCYEAQSLTRHFNEMVVEIKTLMEEVTEKEKALRYSEIRTLHSQINPHFLYNTLDTIVWMAEFNDSEKVIDMTKALAQFFRLSLSGGAELTTVENELDHVRQYLFIQKERYGDQLTYKIECEPSLASIQMPKILLQPIVENALYHGIRGLSHTGEIRIYVEDAGEDLIFYVEDNGEGFDVSSLDKIHEKKQTKLGGVGIQNVDERIKLYYGETYGVTIESKINEGTTVAIKIAKTLHT